MLASRPAFVEACEDEEEELSRRERRRKRLHVTVSAREGEGERGTHQGAVERLAA